jgi:hypothetical protein
MKWERTGQLLRVWAENPRGRRKQALCTALSRVSETNGKGSQRDACRVGGWALQGSGLSTGAE